MVRDPLRLLVARLTVASWLLLAIALPARAQLIGNLPQVPLQPGPIVERVVDAPRGLQPRIAVPLARRLLQRHPDVVALDPLGAAILRHQVVAINPREAALEQARAAGFDIGARQRMDPLGLEIVVLTAPARMDTATALSRLRALDPQGSYDFNHLYFGSAAAPAAAVAGPPASGAPGPSRIGLIDSGVAGTHPALRRTTIHAWGCNGERVPGEHGTAVASLLAASVLYSADIYCARPTGGSAAAFAGAMAWLARKRVAVVNISLVGPDNMLLRRATEALLAKGHVLVAAVGNDGPAAAPLFPAAYPGVIGVTAVDVRDRALPEALRGPQVDFAARGKALRAAGVDGGWREVRGTSFAAPLVARAAAALADAPREGNSERLRARLAAVAIDLGDAGRDETYGDGLVK